MTQRIVESPCEDTRLDKCTKALIAVAFESITTKGEFKLALSEADELDTFYTYLMCDPNMRAMPWAKMKVWFFGDVPSDISAQIAIATHSGIDAEHVFRLDETTVVDVDCCVCTGDPAELPSELFGRCTTWLVVDGGQDKQELNSSMLGGVVHRYVCGT